MGNCFSCRSSSSLSFKSVRVVHINGYVEDFDDPVIVSQVIGDPPYKHFLCTLSQLLPGSKPLRPNAQLEPGHLYFLLPYSVLHSETSAIDMVSLASRLTVIAQRSGSCPKAQRQNIRSVSEMRNANRDGVIDDLVAYGEQISPRIQPWKPILDTINEKEGSSL